MHATTVNAATAPTRPGGPVKNIRRSPVSRAERRPRVDADGEERV